MPSSAMAHRTETTTMPASADHSLLSKAFDWLKARMSRDNEFALMSPADMHALATDIGISHNELQQVVHQAGDHSDLMEQMIRARGSRPGGRAPRPQRRPLHGGHLRPLPGIRHLPARTRSRHRCRTQPRILRQRPRDRRDAGNATATADPHLKDWFRHNPVWSGNGWWHIVVCLVSIRGVVAQKGSGL